MVRPATHVGCMVWPVAPRLQGWTACYATKQHEIKSSMRENDATMRHTKHEMDEADARVIWHTA